MNYFQRSLQIKIENFGTNNIALADTYNNLGNKTNLIIIWFLIILLRIIFNMNNWNKLFLFVYY